MLDCYTGPTKEKVIPIQPITPKNFNDWLQTQNNVVKTWVNATNFTAKPGSYCFLGDQNGQVQTILLGIASDDDVWSLGFLPTILKNGVYTVENKMGSELNDLAAIAWGLGSYQFKRYYTHEEMYESKLFLSDSCDRKHVENVVRATYLVRDLINTPTEDMGPAQLAEAAASLADEYGAKMKLIIGDDLLKKGYPAIHAIGRASINAPRLIDLEWGKKSNPHVVLVGKGVCFDTGGLDLKPAMGMRYMKKDMAGAAHVLGLAQMIMSANLPLQIRVLIPAVENAVSGGAIRPGDVIQTRNGMTVEITNTDAEGRVILCDALAEAASNEPDLIIDIATLTGAARVALGPEPAAVFTNRDELMTELLACSTLEKDPLWQLPLFQPYRNLLDSTVADICNADLESVGGGAIMAALFLNEFIPSNIPWLHFDIMAYNLKPRPSRPVGGEAMGLRAIYRYLQQKFK